VPDRRDWLRLAGFSLCVVLGFPLLMAIAMRMVPSSHGGVVLGVLPLLTAMASVLFAGERPSAAFWLCGAAGSATVVAYAVIAGAGASDVQAGDVLLALSAVSAAAGYALGGELSRRLGGWEVISWALVLAAPVMALLLLTWAPPIAWGASAKAWAALGYVAVFSQFAGFFAWNKGLALGGIAKVGQTQLLQTFVTLAGAALILGERVGLLEIGFGALVVAIVLIGWRLRVERRP
jgi:drug/metabolite transporter (DMT)-like permease